VWLPRSAEQVIEHEMVYRALKKMCFIRESYVGHVENTVAAARGSKTDRSHERALILASEACHWTLELQMCAAQTPRITISKHTNKVEFVNARRARL
jgi:hypothetical protein